MKDRVLALRALWLMPALLMKVAEDEDRPDVAKGIADVFVRAWTEAKWAEVKHYRYLRKGAG